MTVYSQPPSEAAPGPSRAPSTVTLAAAAVVALLVSAVAFLGSIAVWLGIGLAVGLGIPVSAWGWPFWQALIALIALLLIAPVAYWRRNDPPAPFLLWLVGALLLLVAAPLKGLMLSQMQVSALGQIGLAALLAVGALLGTRRMAAHGGSGGLGLGLALTLSLLLLLPWLIWGTLGSPLDTLLAALLALGIGIASAWLSAPLLAAMARRSPPSARTILTGGLAVSTFLLLLGTALARDGQVLLLTAMLWAVGWLAEPLWRLGGRRGLALAIAGAALGPLAFADPNELGLVLNLGSQEVLAWLLRALGLGVILTLGAAVALPLLSRRLPRDRRGAMGGAAVAAVVALIALVSYGALGQPGFHGDSLFVLMREQADLSAIPTTGNRDERLHATYETLVAHADRTQAPLRTQMDRLGIHYQPFYLVNAIEVRGGLLHRLWLSSQPGVERVLDSPVLRPLPELPPVASGDADPPSGTLWNLTMVGAPQVWEEFGVRGAGIVLGQSDSGVQGDHPELADSYRNDAYSWYDPWYHSPEPRDLGGHGTHTTATVVGNTVGVAPDAQWIGCVNLARNLGNPALYLDCMQFMLAPFPLGGDPLRDGDPSRAAHVLNNSWGCPPVEGCDPTVLAAGVEALRHAGIFVVASAGNEGISGCSTINSPIALYDAAFTVGAVDSNGNIASFSSLGPVTADGSNRTKPDIVAPGAGVLSAYPNSSYRSTDGTSMAGPHVAGVVALLWSAVPSLIGDIERTEQILIESATPYTGRLPANDCGGPQNIVGHGIVNAYEAIRLARGER